MLEDLATVCFVIPIVRFNRFDKYEVAILLLVVGVAMVITGLRSKKDKTASIEVNKVGVVFGGLLLVIFSLLILFAEMTK